MPAVDLDELDQSDLSDILTEIHGKATKVKNAASARKELAGLLEEKGLNLETDDEGNFVLNPKKTKAKAPPAKGKAKAAPEPEPEEEEAEEEEAEEEEAEEEPEEEEEPVPKTKAKAPPPKTKAKAKPEPEEEEAEEEPEEEAEEEVTSKKKAKVSTAKSDGAKRAPPPREPSHGDGSKITIREKDKKFKDGSIRAELWAVILKCKTVGEYMKKAEGHERDDVRATSRGFLNVAVKDGWISVS